MADYQWEDLVDREPEPRKEAPAKPVEKSKAPELPRVAAEEKEQRLGSYMTHELRAPLTSIRSALGLLQMGTSAGLTPQERETLQLAVRNAERLDSLINDIMDFSKVRAGKLALELESVSPEEMLHEAVESLRSWAVAKGVRLDRADSDEPLPRVLADRKRVVQVLINLISNAIKFTPVGGKVQVSAVLGRHNHGGTVQFKVKDSGPGIPHQDLEKVFKCFEQSALGAKTSNGSGLGLTLAKAMVELQGGRIWAESWMGLGATFLFTLPIMQGELRKRIRVYPEPVKYHGLLMGLFKRLNAFVGALFG